jgi:cytochrome c553
MMRFATTITCLSLLFALACSKPTKAPTPSPSKAAKSAEKAAEKIVDKGPECTITSLLKPGVPGSPKHLIESPRNPNGESELSHLMRRMVSDIQAVRNGVMNEETNLQIPPGHERMVCTWPTDEKIRNPLFAAMAGKYMTAVKAFNQAKKDHSARFNAVIQGCVSCHEQSCRGPLAVITPLKLEP